MVQQMTYMPTVGEIARKLDQPLHRIEYIIRSRNIRPSRRAGNVRIFSEMDVDRIASELWRIDRRKAHGPTHDDALAGM